GAREDKGQDRQDAGTEDGQDATQKGEQEQDQDVSSGRLCSMDRRTFARPRRGLQIPAAPAPALRALHAAPLRPRLYSAAHQIGVPTVTSHQLSLRDALLALAVVFVWGTNFVVIRLGLNVLPPLFFATLRFTFVLLPLVFILPRPAASWGNLAFYGLAIGLMQFGLLFIAM